MKTEFDKKPNYLWLPDVFGYSWALPQILKKSDIKTFMTTKISWNQYNRMPHDTFIWRGIDGSEVLTHFITTPEPGNNWAKEWFYTYNGMLEPETVLGAYEGYQDKNINQELLISYGFGDGGGGVNRDMLEHRRRMDKIPGLPSVKTALAKDYFDDLHQTVEQTNEFVATWDGELYLEYHRGTYTSQAYVKKTNRKLELALRRLEMFCSFAYWEHPADYPVAQLTTAWESLLRNQFHDIIPGSSIHEVYQDYREEMKQTFEILADVRANLPTAATDYQYFNSAGWKRDVLVETENTENLGFYDEAGEEVPSVQVGDRQVLLLKEVPAFTTKTLVKKPKGTHSGKPVAIEAATGIETDFYQMKWNSAGQLTSLFDKENNREVLNGLGNVFQLFEDKPINFNAWDIDIFYQEKGREVELGIPKVVENNSLYVELALSGHFNQSMIEQRIRLYAHTRRIDFITNVDWQERQQLLKVKFDVGIRSTQARYDIQYGNVTRPTHWNTSWDMAKFETVAHQWADLSEQNYGVSLLNDSKYGHDIKDHTMRLTLLKGAIDPDPEADLGKHSFTYSLLPHAGDFLAGQTVQEAFEINDVQRLDQGTVAIVPEITFGQHDTVCIDALKQAEDGHGWILRIHDHTGGHRNLEIGIEKGYSWLETNLMERDLTTAKKGAIQIDLAPYDIRTMRIFKA
jgi:alpha-mannosidase